MKTQNISDLKLERYLLGELPPGEIKKIKSLLTQDKDLSERLDLLIKSNEDVLRRYKPSDIAERISHRLKVENALHPDRSSRPISEINPTKEKKRTAGFKAFIPVFSALALAAIIIIPVIILVNSNDSRSKGRSSLLIYRKTASGEELLKDGDTARQGDILQIGYTAGSRKYGAIFSIDGNGDLTWHFPVSLRDETRLEQGRRALLPQSYQLDNAPQFERFFFIMSDKKLNLSNVIKNAGILAKEPGNSAKNSLKLFPGDQVIVITLIKRN